MQTTALFALPEAWVATHRMEPGDWRTRWVQGAAGSFDQWNRMRVVVARNLLWVIPATPDASAWLRDKLDAIAGIVAQTVNDAVPLQLRERQVTVRQDPDRLWAYRMPRFVADKSQRDWSEQFASPLDASVIDRMTRTIEASVRRELTAWGRLPEALSQEHPFLVIADPGRPVVIPAIQGNRSGHGKPVNILARSGLTLLSPFRMEGELFAGPLSSLGYGRLLRGSAPEMLDRRTQKALLQLPIREVPSCS